MRRLEKIKAGFSPISISSNSLTHLKVLDALVAASASDLAEA